VIKKKQSMSNIKDNRGPRIKNDTFSELITSVRGKET